MGIKNGYRVGLCAKLQVPRMDWGRQGVSSRAVEDLDEADWQLAGLGRYW